MQPEFTKRTHMHTQNNFHLHKFSLRTQTQTTLQTSLVYTLMYVEYYFGVQFLCVCVGIHVTMLCVYVLVIYTDVKI
jgi:hypothetical protein